MRTVKVYHAHSNTDPPDMARKVLWVVVSTWTTAVRLHRPQSTAPLVMALNSIEWQIDS